MSQQQSKHARRRQKDLAWAKKGGGWARAVAARPTCPTPAKRRFDSRDSAEREAKGKRAYRCPCGDWPSPTNASQLTRNSAAGNPRYAGVR